MGVLGTHVGASLHMDRSTVAFVLGLSRNTRPYGFMGSASYYIGCLVFALVVPYHFQMDSTA